MNITEFLLARIAEDEQRARGAAIEWDEEWQLMEFEDLSEAAFAHVRILSPSRVMAECKSKRAIVAWHEQWPTLVEGLDEIAGGDMSTISASITRRMAWVTQREYVKVFGTEPPTTAMIRAMAEVYADRPGYREEWRP